MKLYDKGNRIKSYQNFIWTESDQKLFNEGPDEGDKENYIKKMVCNLYIEQIERAGGNLLGTCSCGCLVGDHLHEPQQVPRLGILLVKFLFFSISELHYDNVYIIYISLFS